MSTNFTVPSVSADDDILAVDWNSMRKDIIVNAGDYETAAGDGNTITLAIDSVISAYAAGQKFRFQANAANTGAATLNVNSIGAVAIKKHSALDLVVGDIKSGQEVEVVYDGAGFQMLTPLGSDNGSDGALDTSGGSVNINLGGAAVVVKNYSSINVVSNNVTFSNAHQNGTVIIFKCSGDCVISSEINASGMGASGGAAGLSAQQDGTVGYKGNNIQNAGAFAGGGGGGGKVSPTPGVAGVGGLILDNKYLWCKAEYSFASFLRNLAIGSGGGGGGAGSFGGDGGAGGAGGAVFVLEVLGSINFTGIVNVSGGVGEGAPDNPSGDDGGGGGGGGAGGMCLILYNNLISVAGTINTAGGAGGKGANVDGGSFSSSRASGAGGGGGGAFGGAGGAGGAGKATDGNGNAGSNGGGVSAGGGGGGGAMDGTTTARTGGAGGAGGASDGVLVIKNNYIA